MGKISYKCFCCGRENVKLWHPYEQDSPLICASCAEERQTPMEYKEIIWEKINNGYLTNYTGKTLILPKWKVTDEGMVPSYQGPGPDGNPTSMTDELIVNLKDVDKRFFSGKTSVFPAVPHMNGGFWNYALIPESKLNWWRKLPNS